MKGKLERCRCGRVREVKISNQGPCEVCYMNGWKKIKVRSEFYE